MGDRRLTDEENVNRIMANLQDKIRGLKQHLEMLGKLKDIDPWEMGLFEGRILTMEYLLRELRQEPYP